MDANCFANTLGTFGAGLNEPKVNKSSVFVFGNQWFSLSLSLFLFPCRLASNPAAWEKLQTLMLVPGVCVDGRRPATKPKEQKKEIISKNRKKQNVKLAKKENRRI